MLNACRIVLCSSVLCYISFVTTTLAANRDEVTHRPQLRLLQQDIVRRSVPKPFPVADYVGKLRWGYESIKFIAPGGELRWDAWAEADHIAVALAAIDLVEQRAVNNPDCNRYFAANMPTGKTLAEIWQGRGPEQIQISFSPGSSAMWRAATYGDSAPFEWTITENTVRLGVESVASAMVHEATRSNGVGSEFKIAYGAERACRMQQFILNKKIIRQLGWRTLTD